MLIKNLSDSIFTLWVDAQSSGSFFIVFTLFTSPYKIFKMIQMDMVATLKIIIIIIFE
jgi:hypothetical protein